MGERETEEENNFRWKRKGERGREEEKNNFWRKKKGERGTEGGGEKFQKDEEGRKRDRGRKRTSEGRGRVKEE